MREFLTVEDIRRHSGWREELEEIQAARQKRELVEAEKQRQQARKAREGEVKQQAREEEAKQQVPVNWDAIDQRIVQHLEQHFFSGDLGVGGAVIGGLKDGIAEIVKRLRAQLYELKCGIEEQQRALETKFAALEQRQAASASWVDGRIEASLAHGRDVLIEATGGTQELRAEVKHSFEEMCSAFGAQLGALEERLRARQETIASWQIDRAHYRAVPTMSDGRAGATLDLRELFEQFQVETS
jgi:hypothetical protein